MHSRGFIMSKERKVSLLNSVSSIAKNTVKGFSWLTPYPYLKEGLCGGYSFGSAMCTPAGLLLSLAYGSLPFTIPEMVYKFQVAAINTNTPWKDGNNLIKFIETPPTGIRSRTGYYVNVKDYTDAGVDKDGVPQKLSCRLIGYTEADKVIDGVYKPLDTSVFFTEKRTCWPPNDKSASDKSRLSFSRSAPIPARQPTVLNLKKILSPAIG